MNKLEQRIKDLIEEYKLELEATEEGLKQHPGPYDDIGDIYSMDVHHFTRSIKDLERILENE